MKRLKNKKVGARVIVKSIVDKINPTVKWHTIKNISGTIVERGDHEQYSHSCNGGYEYVRKHLIENDCWPTLAIKLDNDIIDIEGNNIIVVRDWELEFLEYLPKSIKIIRKVEYNRARKLIDKYHEQQKLL